VRISRELSYCTRIGTALTKRLAFIPFALLVDRYICNLGRSVTDGGGGGGGVHNHVPSLVHILWSDGKRGGRIPKGKTLMKVSVQ